MSPDDQLTGLFRAHYRDLVRLAALLVDDRSVCEEIVQDAYVRMHGRLHTIDPAKAAPYLRSAVLNGARSHLRRRRVSDRHQPAPQTNAPAAELSGVDHHIRAAVLAAIRALPTRQQEVLLLRFYLDLTEREVAETLGISIGSAKTHARRGFAALASVLEELR